MYLGPKILSETVENQNCLFILPITSCKKQLQAIFLRVIHHCFFPAQPVAGSAEATADAASQTASFQERGICGAKEYASNRFFQRQHLPHPL